MQHVERTRVILVDDHPVFLLGLRDWLALQPDLEVVAIANDGDTARAAVAAGQPDIVVVDLALPGESAITILPTLRQLSPKTRYFVFSGQRIHGETLREVMVAGANGFGTKNEDPQAILRAIRGVRTGAIHVSSFESAFDQTSAETSTFLPPHHMRLTPRERGVFCLAICGLSNLEIAQRLAISVKTVETHRAAMNRKLKVRTPGELARYAAQRGLLA